MAKSNLAQDFAAQNINKKLKKMQTFKNSSLKKVILCLFYFGHLFICLQMWANDWLNLKNDIDFKVLSGDNEHKYLSNFYFIWPQCFIIWTDKYVESVSKKIMLVLSYNPCPSFLYFFGSFQVQSKKPKGKLEKILY